MSLQEESLLVQRDEENPDELLMFSHNEGDPLSLRLSMTSPSHRGEKQPLLSSDAYQNVRDDGKID
ncbi:hypothetical protein GN958_ATG07231 [Phytophthora infestans]|uniref:Uncharacterized protein n=1 Tax=Phytophthora infestans TaxID=4787 RepID=A0A8S9UZD4_PHYIN|nr:hypothetical protein GN958_ATG07231 [Phytophthora infestans]